MARSLFVKHEEKLATSPLLNAFLLLAVAWMVGGAVVATLGDTVAAPEVAAAGR